MKTENKTLLQLVKDTDAKAPDTVFKNVIGQDTVIKQLTFYLKSHVIGNAFPSFLFTGSHGLGKTYVAGILAENMHRRFIEINSGAIVSAKDFIEGILLDRVMGQLPVTLLLDEAHKLTSEITTLLLTLLAPKSGTINTLEYRGWKVEYDLSKINTIFATTNSFKIFPPLVDRCEPIYFKSYSNEDIIKMLQLYLPGVTLKCNLNDLAYACRSRGRDTFKLAQKILRYCEMNKISDLTDEGWKYIKDAFGVYPWGFNNQEITLLRLIRTEGRMSCANIATRMMIGEDNVDSEIEIRPKELGLIRNTPRGRELTQKGDVYFNLTLKEDKATSKVKLEVV